MGCKGIDEWLPDDAVITTYTGKSDFENLPNSGVLVLNGFPFIPEAALSFDGIIFQFPERIEGSELRQPLPILEDPFYRDHFIGPSLGQKWPNPQSGEKLEFMDRVLFADGEAPLAGFIENNSSTIYRQGFSVEQWDHPYFLALKSWARKSIQVEIPRPLALGDDAYELTLSQIPRDNIQFYNPENKALNVNEVQSFFSLEKIALLLALLFALIAIIFVKIS
jgi:hypothetical protein